MLCFYSFLLLILFFAFYIYVYENDNKNISSTFIKAHIEKSILKGKNISENSWCSIEIETYLILFFMCYNVIPNISKLIIL